MEDETTSSGGGVYKAVPWLNWSEWESVRDSLFSNSPREISFAIKRISTWRSRGGLPVVIDVTAALVEVQLNDPVFRKNLNEDAICSEQMLAMLYCMAILRLVNCVVEKTRKRTGISIAEAAGAIGIPRTLIDIRHEGSHRDLPALPLVRDSTVKAIEWLKVYYWDPQSKQIPIQRDKGGSIRKEIEAKLCELACCLKDKHSSQHGSSLRIGKGGKHWEQHCGRSKFVSLAASKLSLSKSGGAKKQITKNLKILCRLYSSFSSEVISVLLEFLLKPLDSSNVLEDQVEEEIHTLLDDWKLVILKFANKEPEVLPMLLKAVLTMIETEIARKFDNGNHFMPLDYLRGSGQIEQLSCLFAWLLGQLNGLKTSHGKDPHAGVSLSRATLLDLLHKCISLSSSGNKQLLDSAIHLARLMRSDPHLLEKLHKLSMLNISYADVSKEITRLSSATNLPAHELVSEAGKKLELLKFHRSQRKLVKTGDGNPGGTSRWVIAKSWNPCPIGMLPREVGSSGRLPVLDLHDEGHSIDSSARTKTNISEPNHDPFPLDDSMVNGCDNEKTGKKREANWDIRLPDNYSVKRIKESEESHESDVDNEHQPKSIEGCLLINGIWTQIGEQELFDTISAIGIMV